MRLTRNWERWPERLEAGALNLITPDRIAAAAGLVRSGRVVPLSREVDVLGAGADARLRGSASIEKRDADAAAVTDSFTLASHGYAWTHLDALGHVWDGDGMWAGKSHADHVSGAGLSWGAVDVWGSGVVTRGVLVDIPRLRGAAFVDDAHPVRDDELRAAVDAQGITLAPGDALVVYSGRDAWEVAHGRRYGSAPDRTVAAGVAKRPGLDASCIRFIREADCALLVWDMMDALPSPIGLPWPVHSVLFLYGVGLIDNAALAALASACHEERRYEFMLVVAPLRLRGASGSPVNPLACF